MSWSIAVVGKPADVKAAVSVNQYIPQGLRDCVAQYCDVAEQANATAPDNQKVGIMVESAGHYGVGSAWNTVGKFEIKAVQLAPSAPPPAPEV